MTTGWRGLALVAGAILAICGVALWLSGGGPFLLIASAVILATAVLEPIYGKANGAPKGAGWRPTDERFIDPETGELVTVWYDPATGDRRYVSDAERG